MRRINLLFVFYCLLSTFTAAVFCGRPGAVISSVVCHLSMLEDTIQNKNKNNNNKNSTIPVLNNQDTISVRKMNTTKNNNNNSSSVITNDKIGGGSVNEKERRYHSETRRQQQQHHSSSSSTDSDSDSDDKEVESAYNPLQHRSHLLHAIEGLNRYPNYLSRWKESDAEALEQELQRVLEKVREQKSKKIDQREFIQLILQDFFLEYPEWKEFSIQPESWDDIRSILDPKAANAIFRSNFFRKKKKKMKKKGHQQLMNSDDNNISVHDVISGRIPIELDTGHLQEWIDEEMFDVYSFPLLSKTFCHKLYLYSSSIMSYIESSPRIKNYPISSYYYKDMDNIGLGWLNDLIFNLITRPISAQLYKDTELRGGDLDWRQGYIAAYSSSTTTSKPRQRLVPHTDDSEVTLNLCFGDQFDGGDLHFWGVRGDQTTGKFIGEYQPDIGRAVIHSGRHLHEVTEITSGNRFAYIQWARSWGTSRKEVCPCCWLNRRPNLNDQDSCVCGRRWN